MTDLVARHPGARRLGARRLGARRLGVGIAFIALLACGCTSEPDRSSPTTTSADSADAAEFEGSPIDAVLLADGGYLKQEQDIYDFRKECMTKAGFSFDYPRPSIELLNDERRPRVSELSEQDARADGFKSVSDRYPVDHGTSSGSVSRAYEDELRRCTVSAPAYRQSEGEEYVRLSRLSYEKLYEFEGRYAASDELQAINNSWEACMSDGGFDSQDALDTLTQFAPAGSDKRLITDPERKAAVAYARCLEQVDYVAQEQLLRHAMEREFVADNDQLLSEMRAERYGE